MSEPNYTEQSADPRLNELLGSLRETPPRNPEAEANGRAKFLAEVDTLFSEPTRPVTFRQNGRLPKESQSRGLFGLASLPQRLAFSSLIAIIAIFLLLSGGAGATAYAAQGALPGDALYSLKTSLEETQVLLSRNAARQAQLHLAFAERRLDEIAALIADGRFDNIDTATNDFEDHVQQAIGSLDTVTAGDPQEAKSLALQISMALSRYTQILKGMVTKVPDPVKPSVQKALMTSELEQQYNEVEFSGVVESITPDGYIIGGHLVKITAQTEITGNIAVGATVKVHALENADDSVTAREIEVATSVGGSANENQNGIIIENEGGANINDNQGGDDLNENENANFNENQNANANANFNANENEDNQNANMNENDNHEGGSNQNLNENSGGEHENDNTNLNENHNTNDNPNDNGEHENENSSNTNNHDD